MRRSFTNDVTIVPKAAPITTATARSTTLPRMRNARKSLSIALPPLGAGGSSPVPIVGGSIAAATSRRRVSGLGRHFEGVVIDPQLRSIIRDVSAEYEAKFLYSGSRELVAQNMFKQLR